MAENPKVTVGYLEKKSGSSVRSLWLPWKPHSHQGQVLFHLPHRPSWHLKLLLSTLHSRHQEEKEGGVGKRAPLVSSTPFVRAWARGRMWLPRKLRNTVLQWDSWPPE